MGGRTNWVFQTYETIATYSALSFWVFGLLVNGFGFLFAVCSLPRLWAVLFIALQLMLNSIPLDIKCPKLAASFLRYAFTKSKAYFPTSVVFEDESAFKPGTAYVFGFEPHSVLPLAMFVFSKYASCMPPALQNIRMLASTAIFWSPITRNIWWWAGLRPVSKKVMRHLLSKGTSVVLCPGGVRECLYLKKGKEAVYLHTRKGFIRLALEQGAPLVPVFCFGQSDLYGCWRPFIDWPKGLIPFTAWARFSRNIGYLPMMIWGQFGSPLPRRVPVTVVVGKPIPVPKVENPSEEMVTEYLQRFISGLQGVFDRYAADFGHPNTELIVH